MSLFAELLLPVGLEVDRDDVEDGVSEEFQDLVEVTGSGSGVYGANLDLEFRSADQSELVSRLRAVLRALAVKGAKLRFEGATDWIDL
ncbi:hypothetical protein [Nocardioides marmorisolisilvae]|nr:hypothetical protein [Nocardioides marmorisolisilvae]